MGVVAGMAKGFRSEGVRGARLGGDGICLGGGSGGLPPGGLSIPDVCHQTAFEIVRQAFDPALMVGCLWQILKCDVVDYFNVGLSAGIPQDVDGVVVGFWIDLRTSIVACHNGDQAKREAGVGVDDRTECLERIEIGVKGGLRMIYI